MKLLLVVCLTDLSVPLQRGTVDIPVCPASFSMTTLAGVVREMGKELRVYCEMRVRCST